MLSRYNVLNPLSPVWGIPTSSGSSLQNVMSRLFQDLETNFDRPSLQRRLGRRVQLQDTGEALRLVADLPGHGSEDIDLSLEEDTLTLKVAAPKGPSVPEGFKLLRRERVRAGFEWSVQLPYAVDQSAVAATLENGRLQVVLPKAPEAKPRKIEVRAG